MSEVVKAPPEVLQASSGADLTEPGKSTGADVAVTVIRSTLAAVPFVGGLLNEVIFDHRSRLKYRRLESFISDLRLDLEKLRDAAVDREHLQSEAFGDLLESVLRRALATRSNDKRARFRAVLLREIVSPQETDLQELFLDLVAELREKEVEMLREYRDAAALSARRPENEQNAPLPGDFRNASHFGMDESTYQISRDHLASRGLLYDDGMGRWDTTARQFYEITDLGLSFLSFVELPEDAMTDSQGL